MKRMRLTVALGGVFALLGCSGGKPDILGVKEGKLAACPDRPNCVSSAAADDAQKIEPFLLEGDQAAAWSALKEAVDDLPRTVIVKADETYLHAEAKSWLFGFVDDLEFQLLPEERMIALRSAARTGRSDFGVNAERLESLRNRLQADGVLR